jgi:hypothetical protein
VVGIGLGEEFLVMTGRGQIASQGARQAECRGVPLQAARSEGSADRAAAVRAGQELSIYFARNDIKFRAMADWQSPCNVILRRVLEQRALERRLGLGSILAIQEGLESQGKSRFFEYLFTGRDSREPRVCSATRVRGHAVT